MSAADLAFIARKDRRVSFAAIQPVLRVCAVCKCEDGLLNAEGGHKVRIELRYLKSRADLTPAVEQRGWRYKTHQGRHAMERFICMPCLLATTEMRREFQRKRDKELGSKNHDSYYLAICGE